MSTRFKFRVPVISSNFEFIRFEYINWWDGYYESGYEPQEFIGVDKNKNDVFCGDIIRNINTHDFFVIEWCEDDYKYIGRGIEKDNKGQICYINFEHHEVMGNTYENPELLDI